MAKYQGRIESSKPEGYSPPKRRWSLKKLLLAAPNWAEVRYLVERKVEAARWAEVRAKLLGLPLDIIEADQELAEAAGEIKAFHKMSLADCFAAALARLKKAAIYSGDLAFKAIEVEQKIAWL